MMSSALPSRGFNKHSLRHAVRILPQHATHSQPPNLLTAQTTDVQRSLPSMTCFYQRPRHLHLLHHSVQHVQSASKL